MVGARVFGILSSSPAISALVPNSSLVKAPACPSAAFSSPAAIGDSPNFSMCSSYSHFRFHACFLGRYITSVNFAPSPGFDETMASPPCNCAMRAAKRPAAVFVDPVEPLEKTRLAVFGDSDAVVDDADCRFAVRCPFNADLNHL